MPWPVHPTGFFGARSDQDTYRIERSLRFNSADSAFLNRTPSSATSRTVWTFSGWVKRSALTSNHTIFSAGTSATTKIAFEADSVGNGDSIRVFDWDGSAFNGHKITTALFRDVSAWYHLVVVWNTAEAAADRIKIYVNGSQITSFSTNTNAGTGNTSVNNNVLHRIGQRSDAASGFFDGYLTEIHFIDGQALTPSSFGETDAITGRWKAKAFTGIYGTNGFYLKFADNSGTTSTTLGKDSSGNGNNWTPNNFSVTAGIGNDSLVDTPTNYGTDTGVGGEVRGNYCTLNPLDNPQAAFAAAQNGNLLANQIGASAVGTFLAGTISTLGGKYYWEFTPTTMSDGLQMGITYGHTTMADANSKGITYKLSGLKRILGAADSAYGSTWTTNDVIGVAVNGISGTIEFFKNNVSQGVISNSSIAAQNFRPYIHNNTTSASPAGDSIVVANFGQRPFAYTAPSGFKALCTTNLPTPSIQRPSNAMDVVTYTGTGASNSPTSSLGFSPDLVWIKSRGGSTSHAIYDTIRGAQDQISSDTTGSAITSSTGLTAFNTGGFTVGTSTLVNTSGTQYVAWAWDENPTSGFDIIKNTLSSTGINTISHSLGVVPKMIIAKRTDGAEAWLVYHNSATTQSQYLSLNSTAAVTASSNLWGSSPLSSTQFYFNGTINIQYIFYLFSEIEGYSKFGSYTGNGSTDGPFVWCGFRPRWVMVKEITVGSTPWIIYDSLRDTYNVCSANLQPSNANAESSVAFIDVLSNGLKVRQTGTTYNASGSTYIFAAFAEAPFKYARAR